MIRSVVFEDFQRFLAIPGKFRMNAPGLQDLHDDFCVEGIVFRNEDIFAVQKTSLDS